MSELTNERRKEILQSLQSTVCACGKTKKPRMSHCRSCYYALAPELRSKLYRNFGAGYEEAYEESLSVLGQAEADFTS